MKCNLSLISLETRADEIRARVTFVEYVSRGKHLVSSESHVTRVFRPLSHYSPKLETIRILNEFQRISTGLSMGDAMI